MARAKLPRRRCRGTTIEYHQSWRKALSGAGFEDPAAWVEHLMPSQWPPCLISALWIDISQAAAVAQMKKFRGSDGVVSVKWHLYRKKQGSPKNVQLLAARVEHNFQPINNLALEMNWNFRNAREAGGTRPPVIRPAGPLDAAGDTSCHSGHCLRAFQPLKLRI
jgi:hypothetical protein